MPLGSAENPPEMGEKGGGEYDLAIGSAVTEAEARRPHSSHHLALRKPFEHMGVVFRPHPRHAPMDIHFQRRPRPRRWPSPVLFPGPLTQPYRRDSRLLVAPGCPDRRAHPGTTVRVSGGLATMVPYRVMVNLCKGNHTPVASNGKPMCLCNRQLG
jgi:hypothetical protein